MTMFVVFQLILVKVLCKALPLICIKYEPQNQKRKYVRWTTKDILLQFRDSFRCPILFSISGFLTTSRAQQPSTVVPLNRRCGWDTLAVFGQPPAVIRLMEKPKRLHAARTVSLEKYPGFLSCGFLSMGKPWGLLVKWVLKGTPPAK